MAIQSIQRSDTFEQWRVKTNDIIGYSAQSIQAVQGMQAIIQQVQAVQGTQGTQGRQGIQGSTGTQGALGTQGSVGAGTQGAQGTQGYTGIQGTQGTLGSGTQGSQGSQGITGTQGAIGSGSTTSINATGDNTSTLLYPVMVSAAGSTQTAKATTTTGYFAFNASNGALRIASLGIGTAASGTEGEIRATNNVTAYYSSDERLKTNITKIDGALDKVSQIDGVIYDWNGVYKDLHGDVDGYFVRDRNSGVIAQQVEKVFPNVVGTRGDGYKAVRYELLVPLLIEAIKELKAEVDLLKAQK